MLQFYRFDNEAAARAAHSAIDNAFLGGEDGQWTDGVTERYVSLIRVDTDWLVGVDDYTESMRGTETAPGPLWGVLPEPVEFDILSVDRTAIEKVNPLRTEVLAERAGELRLPPVVQS